MLTIDEAIASYEKSAERYHKSFLRNKAHGGEFYQREAESDRICEEHERSKHWDGHTEKDVTRLLSLPKAQLFHDGTTSDLISKTETVEHLRRMLESTVPNTDYDEGFIDGVEFGISTVSTMPTIQPQSTTGKLNDGARSTAQSTDLIDRQQAIDALMAAIDDVGILDGADIKVVFDNLPSAQPEPKEGHWIGKYPTTHICSECGWLIPDSKVKVFAYCPNCGAKMKGAQNG